MKNILLTGCLLALCAIGFSANRFFINGGTNNNWNSTTNWSTTSGGTGGSAVPTSSDAVTFDGNSPNCTLNIAGAASTLTCSSYTGTLTFTNGLTVSGSVTLDSAMTISGSGNLTINAAATLTCNKKTWPNSITLSSSAFTFADAWTISGNLTLPTVTNTITVNGLLTVNGIVTFPSTGVTQTFAGTSGFTIGTWSQANCFSSTTLASTLTYTVTNAFNFYGPSHSYPTFKASTASSAALLNVQSGATISAGRLTVIDINSTGGQAINEYAGSLTRTTNWSSYSNLYFVGLVNHSYAMVGNWSFTSGGPGCSFAPDAYDGGVLFDANSPSCNVTANGYAIKVIDFTGYTDTFNINSSVIFQLGNNASSTTNCTFASGMHMTMASGAVFLFYATSSIQSNGFNVPGSVVFESTATLLDNLHLTNVDFFFSVTNSDTLFASGSVSNYNPPQNYPSSGTTVIVMNGTGTLLTNAAGAAAYGIYNPIIINTAGTITFGTNVCLGSSAEPANFTYVAGTVVTTGSVFTLHYGGTINAAGITFATFQIYNTPYTYTLLSNIYCTNFLCNNGFSYGYNVLGSTDTIFVSGNFTGPNSAIYLTGSATIVMNGTGTLSTSGQTAAGYVTNKFIIGGSGTITMSGGFNYSSGTFIIASNVLTGTGSLNGVGNFTLDGNGNTLPNLTLTTAGVVDTLKSNLVISGKLMAVGTAASNVKFVSSVSGTRRQLTLLEGANQIVGYVNSKDMDSHLGQTIWDWNGTFSNTLNWNLLNAQQTRAFTY